MGPPRPPREEERAERERVRAHYLQATPRHYSPWLHLASPSVIGLGAAALALAMLRAVHPWELATVPLTLLIASAAEWNIHRYVLHQRTWFAPVLHDRHVLEHHRIYVSEDMAMRTIREFRLVLLPAYAIVLLIALIAPIAALLTLVSLNVGLLFAATSVAYVVAYEWLHLCYHAPRGSFVRRSRLIAALAHHHTAHHAPELMRSWNFNVTFPLWDLVTGTSWRGPAGSSGTSSLGR